MAATVRFSNFSIFPDSGALPAVPVGWPYSDQIDDYVKIYVDGVQIPTLRRINGFSVPVNEKTHIKVQLLKDLRFRLEPPILMENGVWIQLAKTEGKVGVSQSYAEITHTFTPTANTNYELKLFSDSEPVIKASLSGEGVEMSIHESADYHPFTPNRLISSGESAEVPVNVLEPSMGGYMFVFRAKQGYKLKGNASVWKEKTQTKWYEAALNSAESTKIEMKIPALRKEEGNLLFFMEAERLTSTPLEETRTFNFVGPNTTAYVTRRDPLGTTHSTHLLYSGKSMELSLGLTYDISIQLDPGYRFTNIGTASFGSYNGEGTKTTLRQATRIGVPIREFVAADVQKNLYIDVATEWVNLNPSTGPTEDQREITFLGLNASLSIGTYYGAKTILRYGESFYANITTLTTTKDYEYHILITADDGYEFVGTGKWSYLLNPTETQGKPLTRTPGFGGIDRLMREPVEFFITSEDSFWVTTTTKKIGSDPTDPPEEPPTVEKRTIELKGKNAVLYATQQDGDMTYRLLDSEPISLNYNKPFYFEVGVDTGYDFVGAGTAVYGSGTSEDDIYQLEIVENSMYNSRVFTTDNLRDNLVITVETELKEVSEEPVVFERAITLSGENTMFSIDVPEGGSRIFFHGDVFMATFGKPYKVTATVDEGFEFTSVGMASLIPKPTIYDDTTPLTVYTNAGGQDSREYKISAILDNTFITVTTKKTVSTDPTDPIDPDIPPVDPTEPTDPDTPPVVPTDPYEPPTGPDTDTSLTEILGFNKIYTLTKEQLVAVHKNINEKRFDYSWNGDPEGPFIDAYDYLINTLRLPFEVPIYSLGPIENIEIGYHKLTPRVRTLTRDRFSLNLGTISVGHKYNNAYDFKNTDVIVHLPYLNPITIDPSYAVGQTISIEYIVDAYSGETTINLSSTLTKNNIFYSAQTLLGNNIPVIAEKKSVVIGNMSSSNSILNNNTPVPFIEVLRNTPYEMNSQFNSDTLESVNNLLNTKGRIYVHNISLESDSTIPEQTSIRTILAGGVIIK